MKKLLLLSLLLCLSKVNAQICFHTPQGYTTGAQPKAMRNADFNHDGIPDFVTVNCSLTYAAGITVMMGYNPATTNFASVTTYPLNATSAPADILVADFDGDSIQDLITINNGTNDISVLPGVPTGTVGTGTFGTAINFTVGSSPQAAAFGDFDGNGTKDVAVCNNSGGSVSILKNNSTTNNFVFVPTSTLTGVNYPSGIAVGNFDGVTGLDLAVVSSNYASVTIYLNNGSGVFTQGNTLTTGSYPVGITIGDFDGVNGPDIATASSQSNNVSVFLNLGTAGTFSSAATYTAPALVNNLQGINSGDFDGNGTLDIALIGYGSGTGLFVLPGNGTGGFGSSILNLSFPTAPSATPLIKGDYNLDGIVDLAFPLIGSNSANLLINAKPIITGPNTVCAGSSVVLTANGATTYSWSTSATTNTATVAPSVTTTYTVTGTSGTCSASAVKTVTANPLPVLNPVANPSVICAYSSSTLSATGAVSYTWSPASSLSTTSGSVVVATPTANTSYTVVGTDANGCISLSYTGESPMLTINPAPTANITSTVSATCFGGCDGQAVLNIGGGGPISVVGTSGSWTPSYTSNGTGICAGPQTVTVTAAYGCTVTQTLTIPSPSPISVSLTPVATSCGLVNGSISSSVNGGTMPYTYSWSPISSTLSNVSSLSSGTYSLNIIDNHGCTKSSSTIVNSSVNTASITINQVSPMVCIGNSIVLTTSGNATTYLWSSGANTSSISVSPSSTTSYTVTGTDATGCVNTSTTTVTVNNLPTITAIPNPSAICPGGSSTLTAAGASTYTWNPSGLTGTSVGVTPGSTTNYTVTGTDANGCVNNTVTTVTVNAQPTITATATPNTICIGASTTLTAAGATSYTWSTGFQGATITDFPNTNTTYTVIGADANNCVNTATTSVIVNSTPGLGLSSATICFGQQTATLTVTSGTAITYTWSPATGLSATNGSTVIGSPATTTNYTVIGTDANGCSSSITTTITVRSLPVITVNSATTCPNYTTTLNAAGAPNYSWSTGANTASVSVTPSVTTTYTVTGTDLYFCTNTATSTITVTPFNDLSGTVYDTTTVSGTHPLIHGGLVYIYTQQNGTTTIDTSGLLASGNVTIAIINTSNGSYTFPQQASGNYYLKAVADTNYYHGSIPTYLSTRVTPAYRWDSATVVVHTGCVGGNDAGHDITVIELPAQTGTGVISGTISTGAGFGHRYAHGGNNQTMGAPLKGIDVKLGRNPGGGCAARTTADTSGAYQFTGVDTGSYNIYVDIPNFGMVTILTTTITPANPVSTNNNYCVDSTNIGLCSSSVGIKQLLGNNYQVSVYPNPNSGVVNLQMNDYENARVEVYSVIGQQVYTQQMQNDVQQLNLSSLTDGVYQIRILKNNSSVFQAKIIKQ